MSGTLRPVTSRVPTSWEVWDPTQLPLAVTVQPLWTPPPPSSSSAVGGMSTDNNDTTTTTRNNPRRRQQQQHQQQEEDHVIEAIQPLPQIPKCQSCGAPHPDASTHLILSSPPPSSRRRQQHHHPRRGDGTDEQNTTTFLCYLCHQISTVSSSYAFRNTDAHGLESTTTALKKDAWTFALPLRLPSTTTAATAFSPKTSITTDETGHDDGGGGDDGDHHHHHHHHRDTTAVTSEHHRHRQRDDDDEGTNHVYRVPAVTCPIVWYVVLDGACTSSWYWNHVRTCLRATFSGGADGGIPPHVHVAVVLAYEREQFGLFQPHNNRRGASSSSSSSSSPVVPPPHVRRYPTGARLHGLLLHAVRPVSDDDAIWQSIAGACGTNPLPPPPAATAKGGTATTTTSAAVGGNGGGCCCWDWLVEQIATGLIEGGQPVGQRKLSTKTSSSSSSSSTGDGLLPYAGAFVTCFRASSSSSSSTNTATTPSSSSSSSSTNQSSTQRKRLTQRKRQQQKQQRLAHLCAQAVLTVQSVFVVDPSLSSATSTVPNSHQESNAMESSSSSSWYDPAYERSPVITTVEAPPLAWYAASTNNDETPGDDTNTIDAVNAMKATQGWATWRATWPWRPSVAFGANIRLRTSPGIVVASDDDDDDYTIEQNNNATQGGENHATIVLPKQGGLTGPAVAAPESACLWTLPSLDPFTTLTIDLALDEHAETVTNHGKHNVSYDTRTVTPNVGMLQVCIAYTALEADEDGKVWTVRRIKVANRALHRAATAESLYRRVDPEALAVVLLHKLIRCPATERLSIAEEWLECFLVAVYESALQEQERQDDLKRHGITDDDGYFIPAERLLNSSLGGELSPTDILLAQGHGRLRPIPLLLFLLSQQCQSESTNLSTASSSSISQWDRHGLSLSDLVRMSPDSLSRCLAPRLQLWSNDTVLVDLIDLRQESVINTICEEAALLKHPRDPLLLVLDAPDRIIVANARAFLPGNKARRDQLPVPLGSTLQATLRDMVASYPTPPPIMYGGGSSWLTDVCREDLPLGSAPNFDAWRATVAQAVKQELIRRKHIENDSNLSDETMEV